MFDAISAEALKLPRHKATWFLVWLYPIAFCVIFIAMIAAGMAGTYPPGKSTLSAWLGETAIPWSIPGHPVGRFLIAAYVSVVFAGEYGWNTWKLILPHRSRSSLLAAKYILILTLFVLTFTLAAGISTAGTWLEDRLTGDIIPAGITGAALLEAHRNSALAAVAPALLTIAYASLAAVLTRSTIAGLVVVIVAVTVEQMLFNAAPYLSMRAPDLIWGLYHGLPGYHVGNIENWIHKGAALTTKLPGAGIVALPLATSLAAVAAWIGAMVSLTFVAFKRQDIN